MMWPQSNSISIAIGRRRTVSESFGRQQITVLYDQTGQRNNNVERRTRYRTASTSTQEDEENAYNDRKTNARALKRSRAKTVHHHRGSPGTEVSRQAVEEMEAAAKLRTNLFHIDFRPRPITINKDAVKLFSEVIDQANEWLKNNKDADLLTCETITWQNKNAERPDTGKSVFLKNGHGNKNDVTRGIRMWYFLRKDRFWAHSSPAVKRISFRDFTPLKGETIISALRHLNSSLQEKPLYGNIMKIETLHSPVDYPSEACSWQETMDADRKYVTFLRMLCIEFDDVVPLKAEVVLRDFIPRHDSSSAHGTGFELFKDLHNRASKWLGRKECISFVNAHAFAVKTKKDPHSNCYNGLKLWETASFTEHGRGRTDYMTVLRLVYLRAVDNSQLPTQQSGPYRLSYKTFAPQRLQTSPSSDVKEQDVEDMHATITKAASWVKEAGARVFGAETVRVRCTSGGQESLGPEATQCFNHREKVGKTETWSYCVRLTLNGDYNDIENPCPWTTGNVTNNAA